MRRAGFDLTGLRDDDFNYIRNSVKITVDAYDGTMHFYVNDPDDPIIRAYQGVFPDAVRAAVGRCPPTSRPPPRAGGPVQRPDQHVRALPRHEHPAVLRRGRPVDGADPDERADAAVRGVLRRDAAAERGAGSSSSCSSRWSRPAART